MSRFPSGIILPWAIAGFIAVAPFMPSAGAGLPKPVADYHFLNAGEPIELRVFVDRGILEVYCNGVAVTHKCFAPADRIEVFAFSEGGEATLTGLEGWKMNTMWK